MRPGVRSRLRLSAAVLAASGGVAGLPAGPAAAAGGCDGVLVVVEGRALGGNAARCAASPTDGLSALRQAGFGVTLGTGRYAGGFVCAIDARPARGCEQVDADTYWSYWSMQPGTDRWVYSSVGAAASRPKAGGIEAWVWQEGGAVEPPAARSAVVPSPAPEPAPATPAPQAPAGAAGQATPAAPAPAGAARNQPVPTPGAAERTRGTEAAGSAPAAAETTAPVTAAGGAPSDAASSAPPEQTLAATATGSGDEPGSGPPAWTGPVGLLVAALIGADAFRRARARRRDAG